MESGSITTVPFDKGKTAAYSTYPSPFRPSEIYQEQLSEHLPSRGTLPGRSEPRTHSERAKTAFAASSKTRLPGFPLFRMTESSFKTMNRKGCSVPCLARQDYRNLKACIPTGEPRIRRSKKNSWKLVWNPKDLKSPFGI